MHDKSTGRHRWQTGWLCHLAVMMAIFAGFTGTVATARDQVLVIPQDDVERFVLVDLPTGMNIDQSESVQLADMDDSGITLPAQLVPSATADGSLDQPRGALATVIPADKNAEGDRSYALKKGPAADTPIATAFRFEEISDSQLKLWDGKKPVLVYNHGVITGEHVPEKDPRRNRSCYIHPVWGINGEVLTDDFPKDHYHHHGIFWAWPHVGVGGKAYSLWEYRDIRQQFVRWICRETGPIAATLAVENGWYVKDKKVMTERVWLRVFRSGSGQRVMDITLFLEPVDQPVELRGAAGKSYGGLTMRFNVYPARLDAIVTVPGRVRRHVGRGIISSEDLSNERLPWADLSSELPGAPSRSGAAVFVHPEHPDYPPSWLTRCYGPLCVGWPGVKPKTLEPGRAVRLDYRIWIHQAEVTGETLGRVYRGYTTGTKAEMAVTAERSYCLTSVAVQLGVLQPLTSNRRERTVSMRLGGGFGWRF